MDKPLIQTANLGVFDTNHFTFILVVSAVSYYVYDLLILREMKKNITGTVEQGNYTVDLYFQDVKTTIVQLTDNDSLLYMLQNYDKRLPLKNIINRWK